MLTIERDALLQILDCMRLVANFKVCQTYVVFQLGVIVRHIFSLMVRCKSRHVILLFVHSNAIKEMSVEVVSNVDQICTYVLQVERTDIFQACPVLGPKHTQAPLTKSDLFPDKELILVRLNPAVIGTPVNSFFLFITTFVA